ncbi:MAG TPA: imidazole glycerol phosphate synthase subunit HisH [Chitinophagaceae bacterium]|nr:imidazole glycerol phosphate synthase subunit HisH [Chitinophagaceae bacterium]
MNLAIIKYNAGNIQSVLFALERLGVKATVTDDASLISAADKVIFPGVGEASTAMQYLQRNGLDRLIPSLQQPVLGICLGMQLLCDYSEENNTRCMGIFDQVKVTRFNPENGINKVPQIGWNKITALQGPLFKGIEDGAYCYYVHGYYAGISPYTIASTRYEILYSAALQKNNFYGVQFHPEKSAATGEHILKNFLAL